MEKPGSGSRKADHVKLENEASSGTLATVTTTPRLALDASQDLTAFVRRYADPSKLTEDEDCEFTDSLCPLISEQRLEPQCILALVEAISARLAERRESFRERAAVLATILFKEDDFCVRDTTCFEKYSHFMQLKEQKKGKKSRSTLFTERNLVVNNMDEMEAFPTVFFLQQAMTVIRKGENVSEINTIYRNFCDILARTTPRTLERLSRQLFSLLLNLDNPDLYDQQYRALALLIARDFSLATDLMDVLFRTSLETLQFYILYTLSHLHEIIDDSHRLVLHAEFYKRLSSYSGEFTHIVKRQCEDFISLSIELLGFRASERTC